MAVETIKKRSATMNLENGTDSQGNVKTVGVSIGTLAKDRWDADKVLAIAAALEPTFSKTLSTLEGSATYLITQS